MENAAQKSQHQQQQQQQQQLAYFTNHRKNMLRNWASLLSLKDTSTARTLENPQNYTLCRLNKKGPTFPK